mgnify:CR=1 FL=1
MMVCGDPDPTSPLLLQALGPTGKYYGLYDVPTGPASAVYYGMAQQALNCPNSSPPQSPWMATLAGWGQQQPRVTKTEPGRPGPEPSHLPMKRSWVGRLPRLSPLARHRRRHLYHRRVSVSISNVRSLRAPLVGPVDRDWKRTAEHCQQL